MGGNREDGRRRTCRLSPSDAFNMRGTGASGHANTARAARPELDKMLACD